MIWLWWLVCAICVAGIASLNIALHAQVIPNDQVKIVGSVITTDGLKAAFLRRPYINNISIFYPAAYRDYFLTDWDYVIIEGWFPSIDEFIALNRNHNPRTIIVFYCLDPAYPSLEWILGIDFDAIMTNSLEVKRLLDDTGRLGSFHLLAADTEVMRPFENVTRSVASVFVGAAGHMLVMKPGLQTMLQKARNFGLHLYGNSWDQNVALRDVWRGTLPRKDLALAYASAHIVLASTVQAQDVYGMVNNRIFEALSCGALVLTEYSPTLFRLFGNLLTYYNSSNSFESQMTYLLSEEESARNAERRHAARETILRHHTWPHRIIEMENFLFYLQQRQRLSSLSFAPSRKTASRVLYIVSDHLLTHPDYLAVVDAHILPHILQQGSSVTRMSDVDFIGNLSDTLEGREATKQNNFALSTFELVFVVCSAFDKLDVAISTLPYPIKVRRSIQRRGVYFLGIDYNGYMSCHRRFSAALCNNLNRYDAIFHRDSFEWGLLIKYLNVTVVPEERLQQVFGLDLEPYAKEASLRSSIPSIFDETSSTSSRRGIVFFCFFADASLCSLSQRKIDYDHYRKASFAGSNHNTNDEWWLVLVGADSIHDWISLPNVEVVDLSSLHRTFHVSASSIPSATTGLRPDIFSLLLKAHTAYFYLAPLYSLDDIQSTTGTSLTDQHLDPVVLAALDRSRHTSITYLVAAALAQCRLHLSHYHAHYLSLASSGIENWSGEHLKQSLTTGFDRLFGLPPAQVCITPSAIPLKVLEHLVENADVSQRALKKSWSCHDDQNCTTSDRALLSLPVINTVLSGLVASQTMFSLMRVNRSVEFSIGRDGFLCINRRAALDREQNCLIRDASYLLIVRNGSTSASSFPSNEDGKWIVMDSVGAVDTSREAFSFEVEIRLRGTVFGDSVHRQMLTLQPFRIDSLLSSTEKMKSSFPHAPVNSDAFWTMLHNGFHDDVVVYFYQD